MAGVASKRASDGFGVTGYRSRCLPRCIAGLLAFALAWPLLACGGAQHPERRTRLSPKEIVERSKPAIVRIEHQAGGGMAVGTGFLIGEDGRIATNLHVIQGAEEITVTLLDGRKFKVQRVLAADAKRDLAIVDIEAQRLPTLPLGNSDAVAAGDPVVAIGNPLGVLDYTVSDGLISSVRPIDAQVTVLQISAPISQGSSGGPLFNPFGEVIGVATAVSLEGQNLNFGIPVNYLRPLLSSQAGEPVAAFAARTRELARASAAARKPVQRQVPKHELTLLDDCPQEQLIEVFRAIGQAIDVGAPIYNKGEHEACFRIYEGAALRLEGELNGCKGVKDALGQGMLRASSLDGYTEKAWALRDAFDGLLDVILRKAGGQPPGS